MDGDGRPAFFEASAGGSEGDLVAVLEGSFAPDALVVDERAVEAPEVAEDEVVAALLDDAVLFRDDFIEELDRVVRMAPKRVHRAQLDRLLAFGGLQDQTSHQVHELTYARPSRQ